MAEDMTRGNTTKQLIQFSLPLILSSFLQQLYNVINSIIVGRVIGKSALAAVGIADPIISTVTFFIMGICLGAMVLMAQFFGSRDYGKLKQEISTALITGTGFTLLVATGGILASKTFLQLIHTPAEVLPMAAAYLNTIFLGLVFSFLYNFFANALIATGESKMPLRFLALSVGLNILLTLLFVKQWGWGIQGSAAATVISQGICALTCILYVYWQAPLIRVMPQEWTIDKALLKTTVRYSWASAIQQSCVHLGKLLTQGIVNPLGTDIIAAFNGASRLETFVLMPGDSIGNGITTFIAQNNGAGKPQRIMEGYSKGNRIVAYYYIIISALLLWQAPRLMGLFVSQGESQVIAIGTGYLRAVAVFYIVSGFCTVFQGFFRGLGMMDITMIGTVLKMAARVLLAWAFVPRYGLTSLAYCVAAGWFAMVIYQGFEFRRYLKKNQETIQSAGGWHLF